MNAGLDQLGGNHIRWIMKRLTLARTDMAGQT